MLSVVNTSPLGLSPVPPFSMTPAASGMSVVMTTSPLCAFSTMARSALSKPAPTCRNSMYSDLGTGKRELATRIRLILRRSAAR